MSQELDEIQAIFFEECAEGLATAEQGLSVDEPGFRSLMQQQKDRAKADAKSKKAGSLAVEVYKDLRAEGVTPFTGYQELTTESKVRGIVVDGELGGAAFRVSLRRADAASMAEWAS